MKNLILRILLFVLPISSVGQNPILEKKLVGGLSSRAVSTSTVWEYVTETVTLTPAFTLRDGLALNEVNGKLRMSGGWDPVQWPATSSTNQEWESVDGVIWTQLADAPWAPRHTFGNAVRPDGKLWVWLGDDQSGSAQTDVWTYDSVNGWVLVTSNAGSVAGARIQYAHCADDTYIYLLGGSINDCVRSIDGITWTQCIPDLGVYSGLSMTNPFACVHNGDIYVVCGEANDRFVKLTNHGTTLTNLPNFTGEMLQDNFAGIRSFDGKLFFLSGSRSSTGNSRTMHVSEDNGLTWKRLSTARQHASHAAGFNVFQDKLYIVAGNGSREVARMYKNPYATLTPTLCHSLRLVNPSYTGNCIEVYKSATTSYHNIGFIGGFVDTTGLKTLAGSGSLIVSKWYGQYGTSQDLVQTTILNMPIAVNSGTLVRQNGLAGILFNASIQNLQYNADINLSSKYSISLVASLGSGEKVILGKIGGNSYTFYNSPSNGANIHYNGANFFQYRSGGVLFTNNNTQRLFEIYRNRMYCTFYDNNVGGVGVSFSAPGFLDEDFSIRKLGNEYLTFGYQGIIQEMKIQKGIIETNSQTINALEIKTFWNIY